MCLAVSISSQSFSWSLLFEWLRKSQIPNLFACFFVNYLWRSYSPNVWHLHLRWPNTVFARTFADAIQHAHKDCRNKHGINRAIISFTQHLHYLCIFLYHWTQCIDGFSVLVQRYVRKGNNAKSPTIPSFFFATERTQFNCKLGIGSWKLCLATLKRFEVLVW